MAITYAQLAERAPDALTAGVIETYRETSTVFDRIRIEQIAGDSYTYDLEGALPGTGFRSVNEAWVESTGVLNQRTERLVIAGGDADVDKFLEQTSAESLGSLRANELRRKVASAQSTFVDAMFNGDSNVNPKSFDGLRKRLVGEQVLDATSALSSDAALADLDALFALVSGEPDVVYAPAAVIARYKSLARSLGGADYINSEITGKREWTWNGVSFVDPGSHWSGRKILAAQPDGSYDVFAVKLSESTGDEGVLTISNGGVQAYDLGELQEKPAYRTRVEFYCGLVAQGGHAAARLRGVTLA